MCRCRAVRIEQAGADAIYGNVAMLRRATAVPSAGSGSARTASAASKAGRWVVGKLARELGINATGGSSSVADAWEVVRAGRGDGAGLAAGRRVAAVEAAGGRTARSATA